MCPKPSRALAVLLLAAASATAAAPVGEDGARVRARIQAAEQELLRSQGRLDDAREALKRTELRVAAVARAVQDLEAQERARAARLAALEAQRRELDAEIASERGRLAAQLRAAHALGRQEHLRLLLEQDEPQRVGRMLAYHGYLGSARAAQIRQIRRAMEEIAALEQPIRDERQRLQAVRAEQQREQERLAAARREQQAVVAKLGHEVRDRRRELERLQEDARRLGRVVGALAEMVGPIAGEIQSRKTPFGRLKGRLAWPAEGRLAARFGAPRHVGNLRWQGVMIEAPEGRPVRAISRGRVVFGDWLRGFGLLLIIDHGDGYMSLYGHNQNLLKEAGDWVEAGDALATVGRSGGNEEPGLYFEIRHDGRPVNPAQWCRTASLRR